MSEVIAYFLLPIVVFVLLLQKLDRAAAKSEAEAKDKEEAQIAMEEYEEEQIKKFAELELENEEIAKKKKAEEGRSKNPFLKSLGLRKIKKDNV